MCMELPDSGFGEKFFFQMNLFVLFVNMGTLGEDHYLK